MSNIEKKGFEFLIWIMNSESLKTLIVALLILLAIFRTSFRTVIMYVSMNFNLGEMNFNTLDVLILTSIPIMIIYLYLLFRKDSEIITR